MTRISLVIHGLQYGGAERVLTQLAAHWAGVGHEVSLITLSDSSTDSYPLPSTVRRFGLNLIRASKIPWDPIINNSRRIKAIRSAFQKSDPEVIISFTEKSNVLTILASRGLGARTIIAERTDPRHHPISFIWGYLRRKTYPKADLLVVQTASVAAYCRYAFHTSVKVIPNFAPAVEARVSRAETPRKKLLAVGRLDPHKGFKSLITIFSRLAPGLTEWDLRIVGEGPQRRELEVLVDRLDLRDRVELSGWNPDISREYSAADLFVLSSEYEGFPNALLEAMAHGLAVVSYDCESGPRDIIRQGEDGLLVKAGDTAELERSLRQVMTGQSLRERLGAGAREVQSRFSPERILSAWDEILT